MSRLYNMDTALVHVLGKHFSILSTRVKPVTEAFMKQICVLGRAEAHCGTPSSAVLKIYHHDKLATPLSSSSTIVLCINLVSVMLARWVCDASIESSVVHFTEFLLEFLEIGPTSDISQTPSVKSHAFVSNRCMICMRCML